MYRHSRMLRISLLSLCMLFALSPVVSAQNWVGGLNFQLGFPQGDYKDQIDETGIGLSLDFLYSPAKSPFGIGLSLGFLNVGDESRREPFSTTIPDVEVEVNTKNNLAQIMLLFRAQAKGGPIQPYADGLVGLNYLFTETSVDEIGSGEEVVSSTNFDDAAFAWGGGGGVMIRVYNGNAKPDGDQVEVFIDLRARYTLGGEAEYLKEGSIRRESGRVEYDISKSKTDILTAHVGVTVAF